MAKIRALTLSNYGCLTFVLSPSQRCKTIHFCLLLHSYLAPFHFNIEKSLTIALYRSTTSKTTTKQTITTDSKISLQAFRTLALTRAARPTTQIRTLYFCGPKVGSSTQSFSQHYLAGPSAECGSCTIGVSVSPATKDPFASATVHMTSSITEDIKRLDKGSEKPITTVWGDGGKDKRQEGISAVKMESGEWKI
jgi:hypothetical protein